MSVWVSSVEGMGELIQLTTGKALEDLATERLEADICQLAGNIAAAECRFLTLVGEYDARGAYASWDMTSCAAWLGWKCQIAPGTAREHVRVARALRSLPVIRSEFAAGRVSYSKVRALSRIAEPDTEAGLAELTRSMTAGQLERFARAHRQVSENEKNKGLPDPEPRTRFSYRIDPETGELSFSGYLPADKAAVVLKAIRTALDTTTAEADTAQCESKERPEPYKVTTASLADALAEVAAAYLRAKIATADNADVYQVVIHTTPQILAGMPQDAGVPAGTSASTPTDVPAGTPASPLHPAEPGRCHLEDGDAIPAWRAQMLACTATLQVRLHDTDGQVLDIGRRSRKPTPGSAKPSANATATAASSPAAVTAAPTCTTSSTGPTAATPAPATCACCATATTPWSTSTATSSPATPTAPTPSPDPPTA
jgi:hypothetical protein